MYAQSRAFLLATIPFLFKNTAIADMSQLFPAYATEIIRRDKTVTMRTSYLLRSQYRRPLYFCPAHLISLPFSFNPVSMGAFITIHQKDNDVEVYIATGRVSNIQSDGKIQVTILSSCAITSKDIPSLVLKLGFSVNALENNQEHFQQ